MSWRPFWLAAGLTAAFLSSERRAHAEVPACTALDRSNLIACARAASLEQRANEASVEAAEGRVIATEPWFPEAPRVTVSGTRREANSVKALNWLVELDVPLELSGGRGARRKAALAMEQAERNGAESSLRRTAVLAWDAYFDALAAEATLSLSGRVEAVTARLELAARAAVTSGLAAGVEADLAEALHLRATVRRIDAGRDLELARSTLSLVVGLPPAQGLKVSGALEPLPTPPVSTAAPPPERPEILALEAESRAYTARASVERRRRVPNPTLSAFVGNDGFDEQVAGLAVSLPLPLPEPVGRMQNGEVQENEALARRAALLAERARRGALAELVRARAELEAARAAAATYTEERLSRATATLENLAQNVEAGRLGVKDAVIAQEPLFELLLAAVSARKRLCEASVELARAAGSPVLLGAQ